MGLKRVPGADIILLNGRFYTLDPERPRAEAIGALGERIVAVGDTAEVRALAGAGTRILDLDGHVAIPGPVDAHCHLVSHGMICQREADLRGAVSIAEIQQRLRAHRDQRGISPGSGAWLLGRGFDQDLLADRRWPTRADLDAVSASIPVRITRVCGHALVASSAALRACGLATPDSDLTSESGIRTEETMAPVQQAVPAPGEDDWLAAAAWACEAAARAGFTGVHCLVADRHEVVALGRLRAQDRLLIRVRMQLPFAMLESARAVGIATGFGDDWLRLGAVKIFADGSLGARTAALREEYADDPGNRGQLLCDQEEMDRRVQAVADAGFQVAVHAIGDAALEQVLRAFERCRSPRPPLRIEHASLCPPDLMERMAALGVVAAVQPQFIVSDFWTAERLGPGRARWAYPFRTMLDRGIPLAGSTDCPVEALDALEAWRRAATRDGRQPAEELDPLAALRIFTEGSARAAGEESQGGRLRPGMRADLLALEGGDPIRGEWEGARVGLTLVGGKVAYQAV